MPSPFDLDLEDLKQLQKFYKKAPKAFGRVSAGVSNSMAFESRIEIQKTLKADFTIRSLGMLKRGLGVSTAKKSAPINSQESSVFSRAWDGFTGWEEQERGTVNKGVTEFTEAGRVGGTFSGKGKKQAKAGQAKTEPSDFKLKGSGRKRTINYLIAIKRSKDRKKSFYVPRRMRGLLSKGVYKFVGGRVSRKGRFKGQLRGAELVKLSTPKGNIKPKKTKWMERSVKRATRESNIKRFWGENFDRELNKIKVR